MSRSEKDMKRERILPYSNGEGHKGLELKELYPKQMKGHESNMTMKRCKSFVLVFVIGTVNVFETYLN